ncbi:hypothetical protein [Paraburkholderia terricola]|uniref:hypothetical protein n=1 Tax=Paraburkholderia terricola TaxID=169427 RepID=UPI003ECFDA97
MTDDDILRLVAEKLGNPLLFEDLKGDFAIHTEASDWINFARALLGSKPAVPEGWKIVPIEPTSEMVSAARIAMGAYEADEYELKATAALRTGIAHAPTAPAQPCGEDAANGAMTAAYEAWLRRERARRADFNSFAASWARSAWKACAALTAEKVAGQEQPVAWRVHRLAKGKVPITGGWDGPALFKSETSAKHYMHEQIDMGGWRDAWIEPLYTAPQQPAQSAEQDERRPAKSHCQNGGDVCLAGNRDGICCPEDSCDIADGVRAASTQSTATQPVQAERALTDDAQAAARWHYLARHTVIIDASVDGMVSFTVAKDADSGAGEDAAARAIDVLAAQPESRGEA